MPKTPAKMTKRQNKVEKHHFPLDKFSEKLRRGRPPKIIASWVRGRADNYRYVFDLIWEHIWLKLSHAENREDVVRSFEGADIAPAYALEFVTLAGLILEVLEDPDFPKRKREAQINFLADSIAGLGSVTPRSSRDICERERARIKHAHQIIRYEYWIECSCGYKGRSQDHACPKCEARILFRSESPLDASPLFNLINA